MAESVTIARPYAQAVFRLAKEDRSLAAWSDRLSRLAVIAALSKVMERVRLIRGISHTETSIHLETYRLS